MNACRRPRLPGATHVFTLCLQARGSRLLVDHVADLRLAWATTLRELPLAGQAVVVLPDHLHAIWTEPEGVVACSERWRRIKSRFSRRIPGDIARDSLRRRGDRGLWQRRFWEHAIRDEGEMAAAMAWLREAPVRQGLVRHPADWPHSSFRRIS